MSREISWIPGCHGVSCHVILLVVLTTGGVSFSEAQTPGTIHTMDATSVSISDTSAPQVAFVGDMPTGEAGQPYRIATHATDDHRLGKVTLVYEPSGGETLRDSLYLDQEGDVIYGGEIPGPAVRRPGLRVWRAAYDSAGNVAVLPSRWIAMRETPETIRLLQNMPNPFNPVTTISFTLPQPAHVWLAVYDLWGQEIVRLIDAYRPAGEHSVVWNGRNTQGALIGSGLYLYRFMTKRSRLRER